MKFTKNKFTSFKNSSEYIVMLPFEEQMYEINNVIKYHENFHNPRISIKQKFRLINDIKKFKKDLIRLHLEEVLNNPNLGDNCKPLHELLSFYLKSFVIKNSSTVYFTKCNFFNFFNIL